MPANVTREHKLALIIGFSLVLVVGVLISDHFSKARSQQVATEITPGTESVFGTGTQDLRVVTAAPTSGATITTDPTASMAGAQITTPDSPLPATSAQRFSAAPTDQAIVMGNAPAAPTESLVDRVINDQSIALAGSSSVQEPGAVRPIGRDGQPTPMPLDLSPVSPVMGSPSPEASVRQTPSVPPSAAPREEQINGVPRSMMKRHDVREGESIYRIAQTAYGDGKLWTKLVEYNKGKISSNGSVRQGVTLLLPPREALLGKPLPAAPTESEPMRKSPSTPGKPQSKPEPSRVDPQPERAVASKTYTVQRGDSLSDIAKKTLGSARRWNEIVDLNKDVLDDENTLVVGLTLKLPSR